MTSLVGSRKRLKTAVSRSEDLIAASSLRCASAACRLRVRHAVAGAVAEVPPRAFFWILPVLLDQRAPRDKKKNLKQKLGTLRSY